MDGKPSVTGKLRKKLNTFFFAEEVPYGLALVRILLPLAAMIPMLQRLPRVRELFSSDGATAQLSALYQQGDMLPEVSGSVAVALYVLMLFCLLTTSLGWMTRISVCIATVLYTYFNMLDSVSTITKYSVIATDTLLVMCVANSGAIWSIDSWLSRRRANTWPGEPSIARPRFPIWQARCIQLLVACIYFGAALTKIQTSAFFSGDQIRFWMLTNVNFHNPVGEYLAMMPAVLVVSGYITVVWEMCFIFTVWRGWQRPVMLLMGVVFHLGTCLMLGLYIFPMICISIYFAFLSENDVRVLAAAYRRFRRRRGWRPKRYTDADLAPQWVARLPAFLQMPRVVAFTVLAGGLVLLGVETEYHADIYGVRSAQGKSELKPMERAEAQRMLAASRGIREKDKFFSFDLGTTAIGGILANSKSEFTYGDVVLAQGSLNPPHEDMLVECELVDADGALIQQYQQIAVRESLRCDFYYRIGQNIPPGTYSFVLKSAGREVGRRPFNVVGSPPQNAMLAN